jgi:hypothetical protein
MSTIVLILCTKVRKFEIFNEKTTVGPFLRSRDEGIGAHGCPVEDSRQQLVAVSSGVKFECLG